MEHRWRFSLHKNARDLVAVEKDGPLSTKCWVVTSHSAGGVGHYAYVPYKGKRESTCRAVFDREVGPISKGKIIRHRCDVPLCVNPAHLLEGTKKDNTHDMMRRKRNKVGEACSWSKLKEADVRFIRGLKYRPGVFTTLGILMDVRVETIAEAYHGKTWKWLKTS